MNTRNFSYYALSLCMIALSFIFQSVEAKRSLPELPYVPGEMIVKFKDAADPLKISAKYGLSVHEDLGFVRSPGVRTFARKVNDPLVLTTKGSDLMAAIDAFKKDPEVEYAEPNYILQTASLPNDTYFNQQWALHNTGQTQGTPGADIKAPEAWDVVAASSSVPVVVGVIDTGIDYTHPDLAANIWTNPGEIPDNGIDDDNNGFIDDVHGWNFINNSNDVMDDYGHGTHVAGIIGAVRDNATGIAGITQNSKLAAIKFLDANGFGNTANAVKAINYANAMGFAVTNNSWGTKVAAPVALRDAIAQANARGYLFVAAAGNNLQNIDNPSTPFFPAAYDLPNIISVGASDDHDHIAFFSNVGTTNVDLSAPGVNIYSTVPRGSCALCNPSGYNFLSGTSMATPHVAGVAAFLWSYNPSLSGQEIKNRIILSADPSPSLWQTTMSGARLNLYNAITFAPLSSFSDNFNRPDTTAVMNHWFEVMGDFVISSSTLKNAAFKGIHGAVVPLLSSPNQSAQADFASPDNNAAPRFGIILRYQDPKNYYVVYRQVGGTSVLAISKVVNGVETVLKRIPVSNPVRNKFFKLKGSISGSLISLELVGTSSKLSISDATFSQGAVGILLQAKSDVSLLADNFVTSAQ